MTEGGRVLDVAPSLGELSRRAADLVLGAASAAVAARGRFAAAISGGRTPRCLYELLAGTGYSRRLPWGGMHLFFGDERCVPPDDPASNYRMVKESLLDHVPIPPANVHRMAGEDADPRRAAAAYEQELRIFFALSGGAIPRFDLILLGIGEDGHTASLFPGTQALAESRRLVVANDVPALGTYRLTLTLPVINAASTVAFLVSGAEKAGVVKQVYTQEGLPAAFPAQLVQPVPGQLLFLIDRAAAAALDHAEPS